jgi:hypothetical protein
MTDHPSNTPEPQFEFLIKDGVIWFGVPLKFFYEHPEVFGAPYNTVAKKDTTKTTQSTQSTEALVVESNITYNQPFHGAFYDQERTNEWYWKN